MPDVLAVSARKRDAAGSVRADKANQWRNRAIDGVLGGWKLDVLQTYESDPTFTVITMGEHD